MLFRKIDSIEEVVGYVAEQIENRLSRGSRVLWLVAGGSAIDVAIAAAKKLAKARNLANLTITLTDERYGKTGHSDSNWQQLIEKGFSLPGARMLAVLKGDSLKITVQKYSIMLDKALSSSDYSLALAGMGADGHIFGIKPQSPAARNSETVVGYEWIDYERLTPTAELIKKLDEVIIYAVGREKWRQFDRLEHDVSLDEQPAQMLKNLNKVTIFNDYKGGSSEASS